MPTQVKARWLLTALALLVIAALSCAYLSLCLLFLQGQWQLLYHPSHTVGSTPAALGIPFDEVHFAPSENGVTELTGWWLPAPPVDDRAGAPAAAMAATTVLYLHDGAGSLSDALPHIARLHALGCAVFAIDYRGYGASAPGKPSEAAMTADAEHAVTYLLDTRHVAPRSLVLWGRGTGAVIAFDASDSILHLGGQRLPMVLEDASAAALEILRDDPRTRLLPVRILMRDRLDPAPGLATSTVRKLFLAAEPSATMQNSQIADGSSQPEPCRTAATSPTCRLYAAAHGPKLIASPGASDLLRAFLVTREPR